MIDCTSHILVSVLLNFTFGINLIGIKLRYRYSWRFGLLISRLLLLLVLLLLFLLLVGSYKSFWLQGAERI